MTETMVIEHPAIAEQRVTCRGCPTQIEGRLVDGRWFYFRYRYGTARLGLSHSLTASDSECHGPGPVADSMCTENHRLLFVGDRLDGVIFGDALSDVFRRLMEIEVTT